MKHDDFKGMKLPFRLDRSLKLEVEVREDGEVIARILSTRLPDGTKPRLSPEELSTLVIGATIGMAKLLDDSDKKIYSEETKQAIEKLISDAGMKG